MLVALFVVWSAKSSPSTSMGTENPSASSSGGQGGSPVAITATTPTTSPVRIATAIPTGTPTATVDPYAGSMYSSSMGGDAAQFFTPAPTPTFDPADGTCGVATGQSGKCRYSPTKTPIPAATVTPTPTLPAIWGMVTPTPGLFYREVPTNAPPPEQP